MYLSFTHPEYLLLLPVGAAGLWWSARVSYADLTPTRRWLAWTARGVLMAALVLALSGPRLMKPAEGLTVVFVADQSASIPESEKARELTVVREALGARGPHGRAAMVVCGREALVESEDLRRPEEVRITSTPALTHTDLAAGLRLALGLIPAERAGRVVLLSDGNENLGDAAAETLLARANGIAVDVVPLKTRAVEDVVVQDLNAPAQAKRGEPFPMQVNVAATRATQGTLRVLVDDQPVSSRQVAVAQGASTVELPLRLSEPGFHKVEVQVDVPGETCRENNRALGFVRVRGRPRVLLVDSQPGHTELLRRALGSQDIELVVGGPEAVPTSAPDLVQYDCLLLSDFPSYRMSHKQMVMVRDAVRDLGVGLGMVGGEFAFGAGGYYDTPVEEALPVTMDLRKDRFYAAATVMLVVDTSGSMGMVEDGYEKIQLAAEAACTTVDLLQAQDIVGVLASDPAPTLVCPPTRLSDREQVKSDIRSLRAGGGGIACFPSLQAAYGALTTVKSPVRHIIMLADGSDCDEQGGAVALTRQMAAESITTTTIAFGNGDHVPFLQDVAKAGGGQFYLTNRARDLKGIFTREALTLAKPVVVEEAFRPRVAAASPLTAGLDLGAAPPLLGYVATTPKARASLPLLTHKQDPLLAHWQYGLGRSLAFTSDAKAHWATYWLAWPGFGQFWAQSLRWCLRPVAKETLYPHVEPRGDRAKLTVEAMQDSGTLINGLEVTANVSQPDGGREKVALSQTGPGHYEADLAVSSLGGYVCAISATGPGGYSSHQMTGFALAYPPDLADTRPNEALLLALAELTGGQVLTAPRDAFRPPARVPRTPIDMARWLLWLAALLLPLDVAVRRLALRREDLAPLTQALTAVWGWVTRRRRRRAPESPATVVALLTHRRDRRSETAQPAPAPPPAVSQTPPAPPQPQAEIPPEPEPQEVEAADDASTTERLLRLKRGRRGE